MPANTTIQSTKIVSSPTGFIVEIILSSGPNVENASDVIQLRATLDTDEQYPRLPALQAITLRHVRDALTKEIQRLESLKGRTP